MNFVRETNAFVADLVTLYDLMKTEDRPAYGDHLMYLFAQTDDNRESVIARACLPQHSGEVAVCGHEGWGGYGGGESWITEIGLRRSAGTKKVFSIGGATNTANEARVLINLVGSRAAIDGRQKVTIVSSPWHLLRCFLSTVDVIIARGLSDEIEVIPLSGEELLDTEVVTHSQGSLCAIRRDLIFHETVRFFKYRGEGIPYDLGGAIQYLRKHRRQ